MRALTPGEINHRGTELFSAAAQADVADAAALFAAWPVATENQIHWDLVAFNRLNGAAREIVRAAVVFVDEKMCEFLGVDHVPVSSPNPLSPLHGSHATRQDSF
jgi:hypothetical protein